MPENIKQVAPRTAGLILAIFLFLFYPVSRAAADHNYMPVYHPQLEIKRATGSIRIDGNVEDEGWRGAAKAVNFAEHNPGDQTRPEVDTEVLVTYDYENLYLAWLCYDDPREVRASFCERDRIFSGDYVILCLDTYGEASLAYEIAANPYGIPGDLLFSAAYGEDITYDMIFKSFGQITEFGWVVEMAIPFNSLRFPDKEHQVWRMDFWRNRPRESRFQYSWAAYDRNENCWPCQWGTITGISRVEPGQGLELLPSQVAYQSGALNDHQHLDNSDLMGEMSLGAAWDISSELTAEATINPDFSQIESDVAQLDVNTAFALSYPERRPFFQEGSDLFNTYFNAVYTRSINDPLVAGKMTWRRGSNSAAYLSARDEHSLIILPFEEGNEYVENGKSYSNILRVRRDLGNQSHLGLIATERRFDSGGSGSLVGIDGQIRPSPSNSLRFQVMASHTDEVNNLALADSAFNVTRFQDDKHTAGLDGEKYWGHGFSINLSRDTENYWFGSSYRQLSPTFRADNGFEPSNNYRILSFSLGGIHRYDNGTLLENINGSIEGSRKWNFHSVRKDEWIVANHQFQFRAAQTQVHSRYMWSRELYHGIRFNDIWLWHTCFSTRPFDAIGFNWYIDYGHRIARRDEVMGKELVSGFGADIKPIDRLLISSYLDHIRSDDLETGFKLFSQTVFRTNVYLQASRELSARLVIQYNDRYHSLDIDPLITYRINSLTVFYVGSTHGYLDMIPPDNLRRRWVLNDRQYFMKLQYLFQL
ncbi:MAG: carbohydrate binding family 9 domain-containing protein [Candidatus Krumholzibacteriota bacterium]|nr:carbohydrate binding family 9 domain-containing protein [Candidatus Krumholzibacteriota bacterium]